MTRARTPRRNAAATARRVANPVGRNESRVTTADEYMTIDEVAKRLKLARKTLYNWRYIGKGPRCFPLAGGSLRYLTADVLAYEENQINA